jgi:phosphate transport system substrate-binding protein
MPHESAAIMRYDGRVKGEWFVGVLRLASLGVLAALLPHGPALSNDITGAGSTFVSPVLAKWSTAYSTESRSALVYQPIGSGGGIAALRSETVDFAATDAPLRPAELQKFGLVQFPLVIGGVVPIVNLEGVKPGELRFSGAVLADIFLGKITKWNDAKIVALNPGVRLPAAAIIVAHRVDASGTTFNWANYLSKASAEWRDKAGEGLSVAWPVGVGGKGNDGVASFVKATRNAIGYVEYAYAVRAKLAYGLVQNNAGKFVPPGVKTFAAAAASADWADAQDFYVVITDPPGEESYPVAATSFALMYKTPKVPTRTKAALEFFRWALRDGQKLASDLGFVPLPSAVVSQIDAYWKARFADLD